MHEKPEDDPFSPGDRVAVVDGTFAGLAGIVIDLDEARAIGGEEPPFWPIAGHVWIALSIFGRQNAVYILARQLRREASQ